jgi:hypothetical protein
MKLQQLAGDTGVTFVVLIFQELRPRVSSHIYEFRPLYTNQVYK